MSPETKSSNIDRLKSLPVVIAETKMPFGPIESIGQVVRRKGEEPE